MMCTAAYASNTKRAARKTLSAPRILIPVAIYIASLFTEAGIVDFL